LEVTNYAKINILFVKKTFDIIIVGGGLAGLSTAIMSRKMGLSVLLIEKYSYPFHKVCGEYISNEVRPFFKFIGLDLEALGVADIHTLQVSAANGNVAKSHLTSGGFGISRYKLDYELAKLATDIGVEVMTETQVNSVEAHQVTTSKKEVFSGKIIVGSYGKRGNLDKHLNRQFIDERSGYVGVKYHIKTDFPKDVIALHNFKGGYCGMSAIEEDLYCLCYLIDRKVVREHGSIDKTERNVLSKNKYLSEIFQHSEFVYDKPLVINEISFNKKSKQESGMLMVGDTAGLITPLCGNGMAMAIRGGVKLSELIYKQLNDSTETDLYQEYLTYWNSEFRTRLWAGRNLQKLFGSNLPTNLAIGFFKNFPSLLPPVVKLTHGDEMVFS
jgi:flavin-dependent dehydrogenase